MTISASIEKFAANPSIEPPKIISQILAVSHQSSESIFANSADQIVDYDAEHPLLNNLTELGEDLDKAGLMLRKSQKPDDARNFFAAVYALGLGMYHERLVYDEYLKGMGLMNEIIPGPCRS